MKPTALFSSEVTRHPATHGEAALVILIVICVFAGGLFVLKPKFMSGASKRATASQEATARLLEADRAKSSAAAASVAMVGQANEEAPTSPSKDFIQREVPVALSKLEAPDPVKLEEARNRKMAVMEGKIELANKLYAEEAKVSAVLRKERDNAVAGRRAADLELSESAAAQLALERQRNHMIAVVVIAVVIIIWLKFFSVSQGGIAKIVTDIRTAPAGGERQAAIQAIDRVTFPWMQAGIRKLYERGAAKEAAKEAAAKAAATAAVAQ